MHPDPSMVYFKTKYLIFFPKMVIAITITYIRAEVSFQPWWDRDAIKQSTSQLTICSKREFLNIRTRKSWIIGKVFSWGVSPVVLGPWRIIHLVSYNIRMYYKHLCWASVTHSFHVNSMPIIQYQSYVIKYINVYMYVYHNIMYQITYITHRCCQDTNAKAGDPTRQTSQVHWNLSIHCSNLQRGRIFCIMERNHPPLVAYYARTSDYVHDVRSCFICYYQAGILHFILKLKAD